MADMKLDEAKLIEMVETQAKIARSVLERQVAESIEEVKQVARALRDTPDQVLELFKSSAVAFTGDVQYRDAVEFQDVTVHTNRSTNRIGRFEPHPQPVPAGKYRVLFFLVRVGDAARACDDCGLVGPTLVKPDHHGGQKTVCVDRDACNRRPQR